ncbi:uncharacterized protein LOC118459076 isoform X2 [Anopheles albimanus]|uniref:uncharacterized protein LOC118459076 isoform X2 n=1 Tax=Anopheles albimanus TaxID=7167 RepID=UPI00163F76CE|nr:uncharacterized protein LOC118459076 isoform X2 [Anopheles albimanus]
MSTEATASNWGGKDSQTSSNSSRLPKPGEHFQIGCTRIEVVNMPMNQEGRIKKSHHSLSSAVLLSGSIDSGNDQRENVGKISNATVVPQSTLSSLKPCTKPVSHNAAPENQSVSKEEQLLIDTNRKFDLLLEKLTQIEGRMVLNEKQMFLLEKKIDMQLSLGVVPEPRKGKTDSLDSASSLFSPVSCLLDLERLEELARDKNYVSYVKTQIQGMLRTKRRRLTTELDKQNEPGNRKAAQTYCLRIVDLFFTRFFLTQCSWTGQPCKSGRRKIRFKDFVCVIDMFYETVHYVNPSFTKEDTESFLRQMLANANKRFQSGPPQRKSTSKRQPKRGLKSNILNNTKSNDRVVSYEGMEFDPLEIKSEPES